MPTRRRGGRFFRRGMKQPTQWGGDFVTAEQTTLAGAVNVGSLIMVVPTDYQDTPGVEPGGATLLRIRGAFSYRATVLGGIVIASLYVAPHATGNVNPGSDIDPLAFAGFITGNLVWQHYALTQIDTSVHVPIDVRVKRKLEGDYVALYVGALVQTVTWAAIGRCLLRGV